MATECSILPKQTKKNLKRHAAGYDSDNHKARCGYDGLHGCCPLGESGKSKNKT
jgi:hypothetical protein